MAVCVRVVDKTALKHLVVGWFNTWDHVSRGECRLLCLGVIVLWILVKNELSDFLQRIVSVRPNFSHIVDVEAVGFSIGDWHDLSVPCPRREVAFGDFVVKINSRPILVNDALSSGLFTGEVLDPLIGLVMVLDQELITLCIDPFKGM